jgi:hypothetical protein
LPGVDQTFANLVAAAGGTDAAIFVGATNVEVEFENALAKVLGEALPCEYEVPTEVGRGVQVDSVNVQVTPKDGEPTVVPQDPACEGEGWRYDDPANPTTIVLCPATCDALKKDFGAKIEILLGCHTIIK